MAASGLILGAKVPSIKRRSRRNSSDPVHLRSGAAKDNSGWGYRRIQGALQDSDAARDVGELAKRAAEDQPVESAQDSRDLVGVASYKRLHGASLLRWAL